MDAVRLRRPVADNVEAELAARALRTAEHLALRRLDDLRYFFPHKVTLGQTVDRLTNDLCALGDLIQLHHVAIPVVAVLAHGDVEVKIIVDAVAIHLAQVKGKPRRTQIRPRHIVGQCLFRCQRRCPHNAADKDFIARQKLVILLKKNGNFIEKRANQHLCLGRDVFLDPADADVVEGLPCTADEVENVEDLLAVAETVKHPRRRAQIVCKRPDEDQMAVDAVQLRHNDTDVLRTRRCLDARELLDRKRIAEVVVHRRDVVEAIRIGQPLHIRPILEQLFDAAMQIAHDRRRLDNALAVQFQLHLQHAVRRGVLRPHVERIGLASDHQTPSFRMRGMFGGGGGTKSLRSGCPTKSSRWNTRLRSGCPVNEMPMRS